MPNPVDSKSTSAMAAFSRTSVGRAARPAPKQVISDLLGLLIAQVITAAFAVDALLEV